MNAASSLDSPGAGYFSKRRWDGSENSQSVSTILTEVTKALDADISLRFIWSETKWIEMWWPSQTPAMQAAFRRIVQRGQLEFVGGGWSQNDEVTTAYYDVMYDLQSLSHRLSRIYRSIFEQHAASSGTCSCQHSCCLQ